jgi:hypothetical protein
MEQGAPRLSDQADAIREKDVVRFRHLTGIRELFETRLHGAIGHGCLPSVLDADIRSARTVQAHR